MAAAPSSFPRNEAKAAVESAWLLFTPVWMVTIGTIMVCGWAERWGDVELMALGVGLLLGTAAFPFILATWAPELVLGPKAKEELAKKGWRWLRGALVPMYAGCVAFSFLLNYFQTPFFFDVLHMRYGFKVTWRIDRNPIFLYCVTVPYFATYSSSASCAYRRWFGAAGHSRPRRALGFVVLPLALAFSETLLNANPFTTRLFCYDDAFLALTFGSLCYGVAFVLTMPVWLWYGGVPELRGKGESGVLIAALQGVLANTAAVLVNAAILGRIRTHVAPLVTTVVEDSSPFGGCLQT